MEQHKKFICYRIFPSRKLVGKLTSPIDTPKRSQLVKKENNDARIARHTFNVIETVERILKPRVIPKKNLQFSRLESANKIMSYLATKSLRT
jgi:hypothetical protein